MSDVLWIRNGRVLDPVNHRDEAADLCAVDGQVVESLSPAQKKSARVLDAGGLVVAPGLVDIHVHLRDPGQTHKENIATGTRAAAAGGFTSIVCMPNTSPPADTVGTIQQILDAIRRNAVVNVYPTGCITRDFAGEAMANIGSLRRAGIVAITDDGRCVQNNEIMRRALEYANMFNLPIMDHCQDTSLTQGAVMNEGEWSLRLGLKGWPNAAEDIIVSRNAILAGYADAPIHMQHISSRNAVSLIRRAKARGVPITAEACPHHIALTDEACRFYDTNFKMNPPLRTEADRQAVVEGLVDGTLDCLATDHAPHTDYEKDMEFDNAPFGVIGMETALAVNLGVLVHERRCDLASLVSLMTNKPSQILKLGKGTLSPGQDADVCVFDPDETWLVDPRSFQSRSSNCPWNGRRLRGRVRYTLVRGRLVWDGKKIHEANG